MSEQKWKLEVHVRIVEVDERGYQKQNALEVRQELAVSADGFMGVCSHLGKFTELAKALEGGR